MFFLTSLIRFDVQTKRIYVSRPILAQTVSLVPAHFLQQKLAEAAGDLFGVGELLGLGPGLDAHAQFGLGQDLGAGVA